MSKFVRYEEHWELPLANTSVARFCVDHGLEILFLLNGKGPLAYTLRIEQYFLYGKGKDDQWFDTEKRESLCTVFSSFEKTVKGSIVHKDGTLEITFSDDVHLLVNPYPESEAWGLNELGVADGLKVICMPGGKLAIWESKLE